MLSSMCFALTLCYTVAMVTVLLRLAQDNCVMLTVVLKRTHEKQPEEKTSSRFCCQKVDRLLLGTLS